MRTLVGSSRRTRRRRRSSDGARSAASSRIPSVVSASLPTYPSDGRPARCRRPIRSFIITIIIVIILLAFLFLYQCHTSGGSVLVIVEYETIFQGDVSWLIDDGSCISMDLLVYYETIGSELLLMKLVASF